MKRIYCCLILFLLMAETGRCEGEFKAYQALKVSKPPKIDGVLNDECWQKAEKVTGFVQMNALLGLAAEQTVFSIVYDEKNLYLGIECRESNMKEIAAKCREHDSCIWEDDCIEIFIDPGHTHKDYFHFISNSVGAQYEGKGEDINWNGLWEVKTSTGEKGWFLEIAIPFSSLNVKLDEGNLWGLNVNREHYAGGKIEYSGWSSTSGGFHVPERFGHVIFGSYVAHLRRLLPECEKKYAVLADIFKKNPVDAKPYQAKFDEISRSLEGVKKIVAQDGSITSEEFGSCYQALAGMPERCKNLEYEIKYALLAE